MRRRGSSFRQDSVGASANSATTPDLRIPLAVFAIAFLVRVVHTYALRQSPFANLQMGDARSYIAWATRLASGDWFGADVFYQAPLYPYLLGLALRAGLDLFAIRLVQAMVGALACATIAAASMAYFGRRAGLFSGLILALYAPAIFYDWLIQKTTLDLILIATLLWLLARSVTRPTTAVQALAGLTVGLLTLSRENSILLAVPIAVWFATRTSRPARAVLTVTLGMALTLLPVIVRNAVVSGGGFYLTTAQAGPNFFIGNNETATGTYSPLKFGRGTAEFEQIDATTIAEATTGRTLSPHEVSAFWMNRAWTWIAEHKIQWLKLSGWKILLTVNAVEQIDTEDQASHAEFSPLLRFLGMALGFGVLAPLAAFGVLVTAERWRVLWPLYAVAVVYFVSTALFYVLGRYRYPVVPVLAVFAGVAVASLPAWWRQTPGRRVRAIAVTFAVAVVANLPLIPENAMRATTAYNLAYEFQTQHQTDRAIRAYRQAIDLWPQYGAARINLGSLLSEQGDHSGAMEQFQEAARRDPMLVEAHVNIGNELAGRGMYEAALREYETAIAIDANNVDARHNMATALASAGHIREAIQQYREVLRLAPNDARTLNDFGVLMASLGEFPQAVELFRAAAAADPNLQGAQDNLKRAQECVKQPAECK